MPQHEVGMSKMHPYLNVFHEESATSENYGLNKFKTIEANLAQSS